MIDENIGGNEQALSEEAVVMSNDNNVDTQQSSRYRARALKLF